MAVTSALVAAAATNQGSLVWAATAPPLRAAHGAVASDHEAASRVGVEVLKAGGNAIDAACATALALGVVIPQSSGIGGGGFALVFVAKENRVYALDFREAAPAAASPALFVRDGKVDPSLSKRGGLAVAVPGEVKGLAALVGRWGRLSWSHCVAPAERLAARGIPATEKIAFVANEVSKLDSGPAPLLRSVWRRKDDAPIKPGDLLVRPDLARTLARLRTGGPDVFYTGPLAAAMADAVRAAGGVMTTSDLATYSVKQRTPLEIGFRGQRVFTMPPPSSGGTVIATALDVWADAVPDAHALGWGSSAHWHILAEAMKHGFADRARYLGDPDFVAVPVAALMDPAYHHELAQRIKPDSVLPPERYGRVGPLPAPKTDGGTTHLSIIDAEGNAVALTTTVNLWFGAQFVAGDTGIVMNDEMDDFSLQPGVPNAFQLIGGEQNAVAPRKRPLSSMSPTIVLDDHGVKLVVGGAGGPTIISGTLQVLLNVLDFGMDAQAASAAPRIHHQWTPNELAYEGDLPADVLDALRKRGHKLKVRDHITSVNLLVRGAHGIEAATEYRSGGAPAGY